MNSMIVWPDRPWFWAWMSNYIPLVYVDVINYPWWPFNHPMTYWHAAAFNIAGPVRRKSIGRWLIPHTKGLVIWGLVFSLPLVSTWCWTNNSVGRDLRRYDARLTSLLWGLNEQLAHHAARNWMSHPWRVRYPQCLYIFALYLHRESHWRNKSMTNVWCVALTQ